MFLQVCVLLVQQLLDKLITLSAFCGAMAVMSVVAADYSLLQSLGSGLCSPVTQLSTHYFSSFLQDIHFLQQHAHCTAVTACQLHLYTNKRDY